MKEKSLAEKILEKSLKKLQAETLFALLDEQYKALDAQYNILESDLNFETRTGNREKDTPDQKTKIIKILTQQIEILADERAILAKARDILSPEDNRQLNITSLQTQKEFLQTQREGWRNQWNNYVIVPPPVPTRGLAQAMSPYKNEQKSNIPREKNLSPYSERRKPGPPTIPLRGFERGPKAVQLKIRLAFIAKLEQLAKELDSAPPALKLCNAALNNLRNPEKIISFNRNSRDSLLVQCVGSDMLNKDKAGIDLTTAMQILETRSPYKESYEHFKNSRAYKTFEANIRPVMAAPKRKSGFFTLIRQKLAFQKEPRQSTGQANTTNTSQPPTRKPPPFKPK